MPAPLLWRHRLTAGAWIVAGYTLAGIAASLLRQGRPPALAALLWTIAAGAVAAAAFEPLGRRLPLPPARRFLVLFTLLYALTTLSNAVEAVLFVRGVSPMILLTGALLAAGAAVPATGWRRAPAAAAVPRPLRTALATRPWWSWTGRTLVTALLWVPVYLGFAAADAPFMHSYYTRAGTTFTIPDERIIALAEVLRGLLHAVLLGGLAAMLGPPRRRAWAWLTLTLAAGNGWIPLAQRADWPLYVRVANGLEITGSAAVFAGLVVLLLSARPRPSRGAGHRWAIIGRDAADPAPPPPAPGP
ncbi:hypothetical protein Dvina_19250 [Dactylosporangium vinaceum]|uniref:Uncharacterized protein n=1 Tax=Dactylosporangium vinaceum TaxID=53362 RepID=A0ABV5M9D8_9ACTN|nr:hypothetical protein [Dactylosporangium vinaceum]UAC00001.1 hypothetical protein Dvina_19250 [Dactylosporangium vinaceum]